MEGQRRETANPRTQSKSAPSSGQDLGQWVGLTSEPRTSVPTQNDIPKSGVCQTLHPGWLEAT